MALLYRIRRLGKPKSVPTAQTGGVFPGQRVQIEAAGEVCIVLRVDHQRHLADLLRPGAVRKVETGIPLVLLTPAEEPTSRVNELKVSA